MAHEGDASPEYHAVKIQQDELQWKEAYILAVVRKSLGNPAVVALANEHSVTRYRAVNMAKIAEAVPMAERNPSLTFYHYLIAFPTGEMQKWIDMAADNNWSPSQLRTAIEAEHGGGSDPESSIRKATHASRAMKTAVDETVGTPALKNVVERVTDAYEYAKQKAK